MRPKSRQAAEVHETAPAPTRRSDGAVSDDALIGAKQSLAEALDELAEVLGSASVLAEIREIDRQNLAKYLTIAKLRLENAITVVRSGRPLEH